MIQRFIMVLLIAGTLLLHGFGTACAEDGYGIAEWREDIKASSWESGGAFAGVTALGLTSWEWGSSKSFRWNPEGWFGRDTGSGGADKLGHAFTSYGISNMIADRLIREGRDPLRAGLSSALTTQLIMLYVECFDGFSDDHGFAWEDVVMNFSGTAVSFVRTLSPTLHDLVDYRMEYLPSGYKGFRPFSDYSGQKYLLAFKLGGIDGLRDSPLRIVELHAGYYTRGFSKDEEKDGKEPIRHAMVGVGLNLGELFFGERRQETKPARHYGRLFFEHLQIPYTSTNTDHNAF